tara:strand:- start:30 stop:185 length:156 start_codon:yes stop_codon:yes gene_type:complete
MPNKIPLDINKLSLKQREHLKIKYVNFYKGMERKTLIKEIRNLPIIYSYRK